MMAMGLILSELPVSMTIEFVAFKPEQLALKRP